jgi:hypothetical protein
MSTPQPVPLADQLESATTALLLALERQDPRYLEHLERRQELIERLSALCSQGQAPSNKGQLLRIQAAGGRLTRAARRMREDSLAVLQALSTQRQLARLLDTNRAQGYTTLNVRG